MLQWCSVPWECVNVSKRVWNGRVSKVEISTDFHMKIYFDSEVVCSKYCIHQIKAHNNIVYVCMKENFDSVSHSSTDSVATIGLCVKSSSSV